MTLYRKKILRKNTYKQIKDNRESRDAIVYDVLSSQRKARVYIQGCSNLVVVDIPSNVETKPQWLKPGASVRIAHVKGVRGNMQIVGTGHFLPTSAEGSTFSAPKSSTDAIIYGMLLQENPDNLTKVAITSGKYRIGGEYYTFNAETSGLGFGMTMEEGSTIVMSSDSTEIMQSIDDSIAYFVDIEDLPLAVNYFRIDRIFIGSDGVVDYVKGDQFFNTQSPVYPEVPINHLMIGQVLVPPEVTSITKEMINVDYELPALKDIGIVKNPGDESFIYVYGICDAYRMQNLDTSPTVDAVDNIDELLSLSGKIIFSGALSSCFIPPPSPKLFIDIAAYDNYGNIITSNGSDKKIIVEIINYLFFSDQIKVRKANEDLDPHTSETSGENYYHRADIYTDGAGSYYTAFGWIRSAAGECYPGTSENVARYISDCRTLTSFDPNDSNSDQYPKWSFTIPEGEKCATTILFERPRRSALVRAYLEDSPEISITIPIYNYAMLENLTGVEQPIEYRTDPFY
jgi:hypothetical protein